MDTIMILSFLVYAAALILVVTSTTRVGYAQQARTESECTEAFGECQSKTDTLLEACNNHCAGRSNEADCSSRCDDKAQRKGQSCDSIHDSCVRRVRNEEDNKIPDNKIKHLRCFGNGDCDH
jgi:hypothetical protein